MPEQEKKLELVALGRNASLLLDNFGTYLEIAKERRIKELKMAYKAGKNDAVTLSSILAAYCALDDLASELERDVRAGNRNSKEMNDAR